ncbi:MAG TPA: GspH/FimT family pseudopilin [Thermoanaerobaculia bacterium]|jgi:prepilin-type N-terminal cleavage/methylation domain-containing protein
MQSGFRRSARGFSLAEMLVVVAIVGLLSLIAIPAFINFKNSNTFKSTLRVFVNDLRYARQYAITHTVLVRVELDAPGSQTASKSYRVYSSADNGGTWSDLTIPGGTGNVKTLPKSVWFDSAAQIPTTGGKPQIVYSPSGTVALSGSPAEIVLGAIWKKMAYDRYTIGLSPSGQLTSRGSHT